MLYLISGNGEPNFGDELITLNWISYYRSAGYTGEIFVDCKSSDGARTLHGDLPGVSFGRFLKRLATGRGGEIKDHIASGRAFIDRHLGYGADLAPAIVDSEPPFSLASIKLVHLIGGGYVNGVWTNSFSLLGGASQLARRLGCPVVATGLGIAPLNLSAAEDRTAVSDAVKDFRIFEVRDDRSRDLLAGGVDSGAALREGLDDSFLYPPLLDRSFRGGRTLHLCLFAKHLEGDAGKALVAHVKARAQDFDRTLFWRCNRADEGAAALLEDALGALTRVYNRRLLYRGLPICPDDFMITSRFHPHLLASRAGISGEFLVQSKFYDSKHASVCDLGSPFTLLGTEAVASPSKCSMTLLDPLRIAAKRRTAGEISQLLADPKQVG